MMDHAVINGAASLRLPETLACREIPTDVLLPQLAVILDPEVMKDRLQEQIFSSVQEQERFRIPACEIAQVRYKPESSCMVTYRLKIENEETRQTGEQVLCGRAYPKGLSLSQWEKARMLPLVQPRFGQPLLYLPDLELVLWSFPNDLKLKALPRIADSGVLRTQILPQVLADKLGPDWQIDNIIHQVAHYKAEHTCTVQVRLQLRHASTGKRRSTVLYGKTYDNDDGAETYQNMRRLWESKAAKRGQLGMAKPVAYHAESKSCWVTAIRGKTLFEYDMTQPKFLALLKQAAFTVSALHQSPVSCSSTISTADLVVMLQDAETTIRRASPSFSRTLQRAANNLILQSQRFGTRPLATLHHDLHLQNMYVRSGKVALIDLDNLCLGDPLYDIGRFIASIHAYGLMRNLPEQRVRQLNDAFVRAYRSNVPWDVPQRLVDWYVTTALIVKNAMRCARRLQSGLLGDLADIIERVSRDAVMMDGVSVATEPSACVNSQAVLPLSV